MSTITNYLALLWKHDLQSSKGYSFPTGCISSTGPPNNIKCECCMSVSLKYSDLRTAHRKPSCSPQKQLFWTTRPNVQRFFKVEFSSCNCHLVTCFASSGVFIGGTDGEFLFRPLVAASYSFATLLAFMYSLPLSSCIFFAINGLIPWKEPI